jgi:hypothetical protein
LPGNTKRLLVNGDRLPEPNETFVLNLSGATSAVITQGNSVGTIVDGEPRISITDVTNSEGRNNHTTLFTLASRKNAIASSMNGREMSAPKVAMNSGQSKPSAKESTVPETAPTANSSANAFDQRRASVRQHYIRKEALVVADAVFEKNPRDEREWQRLGDRDREVPESRNNRLTGTWRQWRGRKKIEGVLRGFLAIPHRKGLTTFAVSPYPA